MSSVCARLGASLALVVVATLVPAVTSAASATPAPTSGAPSVSAPRASSVTAVAATARSSRASSRAMLRNAVSRGRLVIRTASRYRGIPYRAGGTSPASGFDCSGYTRYVFSKLGIAIPRVSGQQYASMLHISRSQAVPGDLVFFHSRNGHVYHAAIYAGGNAVWHSPFPGRRVMYERIWTSAVYFARVRV